MPRKKATTGRTGGKGGQPRAVSAHRSAAPAVAGPKPWKPSLVHRKALDVYLEDPQSYGTNRSALAHALEMATTTVQGWFRDSRFLAWWGAEVMTRLRSQPWRGFDVLVNVMEDDENEPRDRVQAAKVYLEKLPPPQQQRSQGIRDLFDSARAAAPGTTVRGAMDDASTGERVAFVVERHQDGAPARDLADRGAALGVTEATPENADDVKAGEGASAFVLRGESLPPPGSTGDTGSRMPELAPPNAGEGGAVDNHGDFPHTANAPPVHSPTSRVPHCPECWTPRLGVDGTHLRCRCGWQGMASDAEWRPVYDDGAYRMMCELERREREFLVEKVEVWCPVCLVPSWGVRASPDSEGVSEAECCVCHLVWDPRTRQVDELDRRVGIAYDDCRHESGIRGGPCGTCHRNRMDDVHSGKLGAMRAAGKATLKKGRGGKPRADREPDWEKVDDRPLTEADIQRARSLVEKLGK